VGDQVSVFYDEAQLSPIPKETDLIEDMGQYSVWFKPAGMDVQGSDWGDFNTLVRQVELMCHGERKVLPVFNMATEAGGLMVIAHDKRAAADLTALFQKGDVEKRYRIEVRGQCESAGEMTLEANGVSMPSRYTPVTYNDHSHTSKVDVFTASSEAPIRHYFDSLSTPIMGDPEYGEDNISRSGMQLKLADIAFECPVTNQSVSFSLYS
jgi:tRNA pseudouridine32 synthase/23S rRNA pseudouridine746 synthase